MRWIEINEKQGLAIAQGPYFRTVCIRYVSYLAHGGNSINMKHCNSGGYMGELMWTKCVGVFFPELRVNELFSFRGEKNRSEEC